MKEFEPNLNYNRMTLPTDQGFQLWRLFETPTYKKIRVAQEYLEKVGLELVTKKIDSMKSEDYKKNVENPLLEQYLKNPKLDVKDIIGMATDLLLAGVHTVIYILNITHFGRI